jgi:hypothetical protein
MQLRQQACQAGLCARCQCAARASSPAHGANTAFIPHEHEPIGKAAGNAARLSWQVLRLLVLCRFLPSVLQCLPLLLLVLPPPSIQLLKQRQQTQARICCSNPCLQLLQASNRAAPCAELSCTARIQAAH